MSFAAFKLNTQILDNLKTLNYQTPTPIQQKSIPVVLSGQDVMGLAQTGTGKTAAFALPIIQRLMTGPRGCLRALIIAPTRELAQQIHEAFMTFCRGTKLRSMTLYGGVNINPQIKNLGHGFEIVVACPGRLLDHVQQQTIKLTKVEVLVLDEADQMFDMGFLPDIRKILRHLPKKRQTLLFSATMPDAINELAHEVLHDPFVVKIGHDVPATSVKQVFFPVPAHLKTELLLKILHHMDVESTLVFTRTKHGAKNLAKKIEQAGFSTASLQGNLSQNKRLQAMNGFRDGSIQILVATDIASRGIDVTGISHVINYDIPNTVESYIHRIGRTGRAEKLGEAFTLITREDNAEVRNIERRLGRKIEQYQFDDFNYSAAAPAKRPLGRVVTTKKRQKHN